jgi:nicotinamide mononucleotide transporter
MSAADFYHQFVSGIQQTGPLEFIAVFAGIGSVWYSRKENILVYPVGLVSTVIYIYLSLKGNLLGEASVNFYYTVMSIYGWMLWARKDNQKHETILHISYSSRKEWIQQLGFFAVFYIVIFASLTWAKQSFAPEAIPWADAFASASAYTGMWLMTKKKIENWIWWIITDLASVPLYFVKGYAFSSFQFAVFTVMAVWGLVEWRKRVLNRGILNKEQKNK